MDFKLLYGDNADLKKVQKRIFNLKSEFTKREKLEPDYIFSSPGRAEILGNHTDHNHGLVIVSSISCDILAAVKKTDNSIIKLFSCDYDEVVVDFSNLDIKTEEYGTSKALVKGVCKGIIDKGYKFKGFTAYTTSNIFKGAGLSSSAAFEVLICEIINVLYLNNILTDIDRAIISQYAENVYFNKPCGLLDQCGISIGSLCKLDFNTPTNPLITKLNPFNGYTLVITNTGGDHANLTKHYSEIRKEMEMVAEYFGKPVLREVEYADFLKQVPNLTHHFSSRAILRAIHFYRENARVEKAEKHLLSGNIKGFLEQVNESGLSSLNLLQNCYLPGEVNQPIVLGIELSRSIIKDGACRVHGGGFAGSILAIVNNNEVENYSLYMKKVFGKENVLETQVRKVGTMVIS